LFQINVTQRIILSAIVFSLLFGALFQLPWNFGPSSIMNGVCYPIGVWSSIASKRVCGIYVFIAEYLFPVAAMTFCYGRVFYVLHKKVKVSWLWESVINAYSFHIFLEDCCVGNTELTFTV